MGGINYQQWLVYDIAIATIYSPNGLLMYSDDRREVVQPLDGWNGGDGDPCKWSCPAAQQLEDALGNDVKCF